MYTGVKVNHIGTFYTLPAAMRIVEEEKKRKKENTIYYIKQKICGLILVVLSILMPLLCNDGTASIILLPTGIGLIATKEKVMTWKGWKDELTCGYINKRN